MNKVEIIGPKKYFYQALAVLHQIGTLHVEDLSEKEDLILRSMDIDSEATESRKDLRDLLTRINGIITAIEPEDSKSQEPKNKDELKKLWSKKTSEIDKEANKLLSQLEEKTRSLASKKSQLELELASLGRYQDVMQKIYPLAKSIVTLKGSETVAFLLEGEYKDTVNIVNKEMSKITKDNHELISTPIDETTTAAIIVFNKKYSGKVHKFLADKVNQLNLPTDMKDLTIDSVIKEIQRKQVDYPKDIEKIQQDLDDISTEWYFKLKEISSIIASKLDEIEQIPSFGQTEYTFVIHGWLPHKKVDELKKELNKNFGSKVLLRQLELTPEDLEDAPVVMENPGWAKPFEFFTKVMKPPRYGTVDPTIFVAIFFPIFFGFIVGDLGYGFVVFMTSTILRYSLKDKKSELINMTTRLFQIAGASTMIFGFFYGEALGNVLELISHKYHLPEVWFNIGPLHIPYHRNPNIANRLVEFIVISVVFGYIHQVVSLSIGVVNAVKEKSRKHMWEKIGVLTYLIALVGFGAGLALKNSFISTPMMLLIIASIAMMVYGGGVLAILEYPIGIIANLASYLRLMALGFAGAILAVVANNMVTNLGSIEIGILLAVLLHIINVIVHTFSPAIHSIRLNLLEGFGKFYEEGGKEYKPFEIRR